MKLTTYIKTIILSLLTFLLGTQTTYAKTEVVLPQNKLSFSIEQSQSFTVLQKQVQPNIGFLKEKTKFVIVEGISARNCYNFSEGVGESLAEAGGDLFSSFTHLKNLPTDTKTFLSAKNWDNALLTKLDGDLATTAFKNTIDVNPQLIDAWEIIRRNIDNFGTTTTKFALDETTLSKVAEVMQDGSNFRTKITALGHNWETTLDDILKAAHKNPCPTCGMASGLTKGLSPIHKYFDDLDYFLTHFTNKPGANDLNHWVLGKGVNTPTVTVNNWSVVNQTLDYLKKNQIHTKSDIEFGKKFQSTAGNSSRKSDLYYKVGNDVFHKEFKNAQITSLSNQRVDQVVRQYGAFSKINNLNEYEWIAILGKNEGKLDDIKALWKQAFIDNAENMFNNLGQDKINQLFKLDGMNTITNFNQFKSLLNNNQVFLDNALKFIKVE